MHIQGLLMKKYFTIRIVVLCFCLSMLQIAPMDKLTVSKKETRKQFVERSENLHRFRPGCLSETSVWDPCNNQRIYLGELKAPIGGELLVVPYIELRSWDDQAIFVDHLPAYKNEYRYNTVALSANGKKVAATREYYAQGNTITSYALDIWKIVSKQKLKLVKTIDVSVNIKGVIPWCISFNLTGDKIIIRSVLQSHLTQEKPEDEYTIFKIKN